MTRRPRQLMDQIRDAIEKSGMSRYYICKELDIPQSSMSRYMSGQSSLSEDNLNAIGDLLHLKITIGSKSRTPKGK